MGRLQSIGDIQPFAELAQGAATVVYKGYQRSLDRFVLLKVLRPELAQDERVAKGFAEEARLVARVQHPNVIAIYAYGREDGQAYLAAEYVDGVDLEQLLAAGPLPVPLAVFVLREAARGLRAAHEQGVLHRDLKPPNLMISARGQVKLTDFGFASLWDEQSGEEVRGTLAYLAPEQARGEPPTPSADLFSLGAVFYETLLGRPAFVGADAGEVVDRVLNYDALPVLERAVALPPGLLRVCRRLLAKDPAARYASAEALLTELEALPAGDVGEGSAADLAAYVQDPEAYRHASAGPHERRAAAPPGGAGTFEGPSGGARLARPAPAGMAPFLASRRGPVFYVATVLLVLAVLASAGAAAWWHSWRPASENAPLGEAPPVEAPAARDPVAVGAGDGLPDAEGTDPARPDTNRIAEDVPVEDVPEEDPPVREQQPASSLDEAAMPLAVSVQRSDSAPSVPQVVPGPGSSDPADEAAQTPRRGRLQLHCEPWALVVLGGDTVATTPLAAPLDVPAGRHRLTLKNPGFPPYEATIEVNPGETTELVVSLWSLVGRLQLQVAPWAVVLVDGVVQDTIPPQQRPLIVMPGAHELSLQHPVLGTWTTTVQVGAGETKALRYDLAALLGR